MTLKNIQQAFEKAIYELKDDDIFAAIEENGIEKDKRLQVYKDNVLLNLQDTLKRLYPAVCALVDEIFFKYAAVEYIKNNRPTSGNLDEYGESFADFLADFEPAKSLPYLMGVAKLEWAQHLAYFAADCDAINNVALSQTPPDKMESLKFTLHPSTQFIKSQYPIDKIWEIAMGSDEKLDINERGAEILVVRPEYKIETILLEAGEFEFLTALQNGSRLYEAYEAAAVKNEDFDVIGAITKFVENGAFVGFEVV